MCGEVKSPLAAQLLQKDCANSWRLILCHSCRRYGSWLCFSGLPIRFNNASTRINPGLCPNAKREWIHAVASSLVISLTSLLFYQKSQLSQFLSFKRNLFDGFYWLRKNKHLQEMLVCRQSTLPIESCAIARSVLGLLFVFKIIGFFAAFLCYDFLWCIGNEAFIRQFACTRWTSWVNFASSFSNARFLLQCWSTQLTASRSSHLIG